MYNDETMVQVTAKLSGIILRKAELESDFDGVYSAVFERMFGLENVEGDEFLMVLGEIGG
ncbi:MAG: hypothetical protein HY833_02295 [Candidatus Aenigmarchaeota archaeon]|nr:hypothetical protein [Candidatus Aenigmarchaeota archaeon]